MISFQDAAIRRYDTVIFENFNWKIQVGEQWAIVGQNGSGKSTLLEVLAGKWPLWRGKLTHGWGESLLYKIAELVPSDYSFNRIVRSAAQYYQQRFHSFEAEVAPTVREILTNQLRPIGTHNPLSVRLNPSDVSEEELLKICQILSIDHLLDRHFVTLSNGETRRMMLVKSLLKKPKLLLMDNPFAGLDTHSREVLRNALKQMKEAGVLVVLVTPETEIPESVTHILRVGQASRDTLGKKWNADSLGNADFHGFSSDSLPLVGTTNSDPQSSEFAVRECPQEEIALQMNTPLVGICNSDPQSSEFAIRECPQEEIALQMNNINVVYGGKKVLDSVNWEIKKGERWALVGPNGSGKSTLLSIITADNPQRFANDYSLFGHKRGGASMWDAKSCIGHVSPELHLYFPQETTVFKTIASGFFDATGVYFKKITDQQSQQVEEVAAWLHVHTFLEKPFKNISKGQQRLVLLARALVKNPPLLILDEPCQGLDFAAVEHFKSVIDRICASPERTLIYVSHYPHEIPSCVTKTLRLSEGKAVESA